MRHLPNTLSIARILAAPLLVGLAAGSHLAGFIWVLVPALLSDIAEGMIARRLHLESALGAVLDSVADVLLLCACLS